MPKPLVLYRADSQDGRTWLVLSPKKPGHSTLAALLGLSGNQLASITTAQPEDAQFLTVQVIEGRDIPLLIFEA